MMRTIVRFGALASFLLLLCAPPVVADVLVLKSGEEIECRILQEGRIGVRIKDKDNRTRSIPNGDIEKIIRGEPSWDVFDRRWKEVGKKDVDDMFELAGLAKKHDLPKRLKKALDAIFKLAPDHAEARELGGYVRDGEGTWRTREELERRELLRKVARMPDFRPGRHDRTIGGEAVVLDVPRGYSKARPHAVVFVFHGKGDTAANFLNWYFGGFKPKGYVLISCENNDASNDPVGKILKELDTVIHYDPDRMYTFGFSMGSYPAAYVPFKYKDTFAAAAFGGGGLPVDDVPEAGKNAHASFIWCGKGDVNHFPIAEKSYKVLKKRGYEAVWKPFSGGHTDVPGGLVKEVFQFFAKHKRKR